METPARTPAARRTVYLHSLPDAALKEQDKTVTAILSNQEIEAEAEVARSLGEQGIDKGDST